MHGHTVCATYIRTYICTYHGQDQGDGGTAIWNGEPVMANITLQSNAITEQSLRHFKPIKGL